MFLEHFGFREQPFGATPDPRFLYFSAQHAEAAATLHYGLAQRRGFQVLIARPGLGKTTLLQYLLERWKDRAEVAFVFHPPETREQMIAAVLEDLGLASSGGYLEGCRLLRALALDCYRHGKRLLLVFDEAQRIPAAVLEEIRLLSNFEMPEEKLFEVILAGQPSLAERLESPDCDQLRQRISVQASLRELDTDEVRRYLEHRLRVAGDKRGKLFTRRAIALLTQASRGVPRNINTLAFDALSAAFAEGKKKVDTRHFTATPAVRHSARWATRAATVGLAMMLALGMGGRDAGIPRHRAAELAGPAEARGQGDAEVRAREDMEAGQDAEAPGEPDTETSVPDDAAPPGQPDPEAPASRDNADTVQIRPADTLRQIALRQYGRWDFEVWRRIRKNNPWLASPDKLRAGKTLLLPAEAEEAAP